VDREKAVNGLGRDLPREIRVPEQRLDLRGEHQGPADFCIKERLLAEPVAGEHEPLPLRVPDREREHAIQRLGAPLPELLVKMDQDLGVAARLEAVPLRLERAAQLLVVVDLAVEDDLDRAVLVPHRLGAQRRQVDDRQPTVAERALLVFVKTLSVRPAVGDRRGHRADHRGPVARGADDAG
jgi:hypothetical protein